MNLTGFAELFFSKVPRFFRRTAPLLICLAVTGCPDSKPTATNPSGNPSQKVVIRGSNTIGEELAPKLITAYQKDHAGVAFDVETKGTGYGFAAVRAGICDLAGASRPPLAQEVEQAQASGIQLNDYVIGSYSVAVVINSSNPLINLTREQVRDIFTGRIKNWKEVGGADNQIHLYTRDPISGTALGFQELAMENKAYALNAKLLTNYDAIVEAVAKDPIGIGYSSFNASRVPGAKAVTIGGVPANAASVNAGKYPYTRILRFYTNKDAESAPARDFLQFVLSSKGQQVLADAGFVPKP